MSTDKGFIKVYRDIREHWIWNEKPFDRGRAWIDLIMLANHKDSTIMFDGHPMTIKRGQHMTSLKILSERWGWSRSKTKRFIDDLKSEQMLDVLRNTRGTLLTIEKYSIYQDTRNTKRNTDETLTERSRNTDEHKQECRRMKKNVEEYSASQEITQDELEQGGWGFE